MSQTPAYSESESRNRDTFLALMWGFSHPGELQPLGHGNIVDTLDAFGAALMDLETTFFTPDGELAAKLAANNARRVEVGEAQFVFLPELNEGDLELAGAAFVGDMMYPERSATVIIGCALGQGQTIRFTGPGIANEYLVTIDRIPEKFWQLRADAIDYPLGWDAFLVDGRNVVGLPRSTTAVPV